MRLVDLSVGVHFLAAAWGRFHVEEIQEVGHSGGRSGTRCGRRFQVWRARQSALPKGIASGNGRIEAKLVDVAAKEPLRVKEILVKEGQLVQPGEVLVRLDTATLESQLAEAKANVAATEQKAAVNKSAIARRKSEVDSGRDGVGTRSQTLRAECRLEAGF